jgi:hypothetical protein
MVGNFGGFWKFRENREEKESRISSGQTDFVKEIEKYFSVGNVICYPWPNDIAGRFARAYFYPVEVELAPKSLVDCNFLVLDNCASKRIYPIEKQIKNDDQLIYNSSLGKVYKINDN